MTIEHDRLDLLLEAGRFDAVLTEAHRLLATDPNDPELWHRVLRAQLGLEQHAAALDAAGRLAFLAPDSAIGHIGASAALLQLKRVDEAVAAAQRAVVAEPGNLYSHVQLAEAASTAKRTRDLAWAAANQAVSLEPNEATSHAVMGLVALRTGRQDVAEVALRRALELDPTNHAAQHNLGLIRVSQGQLVEGAHDIGASAAQDPNSAQSNLAFQMIALRWLQRTHLGMWAVWFGARFGTVGRDSITVLDAASTDQALYAVTRVTILLGLVIFIWWTRRTVLALGGHLRRVVWAVMRRSVPTMIWFLSVAAGAVGLAWALISPWPELGTIGLYFTGASLLVGCLASWAGVAARSQR